MASWTIVIEGTGPYQTGEPGSADKIVEKLQEELRSNGHNIDRVTIISREGA